MNSRLFDLLLGMFLGNHAPSTIMLFGISLDLAFTGLCVMGAIWLLKKVIPWLLKKLFRWSVKVSVQLWKKLIETVKAEVLKELAK